MAAALFLGGYAAPAQWLDWIPSWVWFFTKMIGFIFLLIWVRGTAPRLRMDQLMNFAWKFMLPMALVNIAVAGLWRFLPAGFARWAVCSAMLIVPYVLLGRGLLGGKHSTKRTYRYAE